MTDKIDAAIEKVERPPMADLRLSSYHSRRELLIQFPADLTGEEMNDWLVAIPQVLSSVRGQWAAAHDPAARLVLPDHQIVKSKGT